jgi:hypothetical protein
VAPAALHVIVSSPQKMWVKFRRASTCQISLRSEVVLSPSAHRVVRWSLSLGVLLAGPIYKNS